MLQAAVHVCLVFAEGQQILGGAEAWDCFHSFGFVSLKI